MNQLPYSARHHKAGFTLIELVVVIVVLGILAAIVVVGYGSLTDRATAKSVERTGNAFDREYRALLAFGETQDAAADTTALDFGGTATVNDPATEVEFTVNGASGCLTLSADAQTPSTYTAGSCGAEAPEGAGVVTGSVTLDGDPWVPGMMQGGVTLYKNTGFGMYTGYSPVYQNGTTVGGFFDPQVMTTISAGSFSLSLPGGLQAGEYAVGFTGPGNQFYWMGGGSLMSGPTSPFSFPAENGKAYPVMDITSPTVSSAWNDKALTAMNTKMTEYFLSPTVSPTGWTTQSFSIVSGPSHGSATLASGMMGQALQYTPTSAYEGSDSIVIRMTDSQLGAIDATWTFTVVTPTAPAAPTIGSGGLTYDAMMMDRLMLDIDTADTTWEPIASQMECRSSTNLSNVVAGMVSVDLMTSQPVGYLYSANMHSLVDPGTTVECRANLGVNAGTAMAPNYLRSAWTEWVSLSIT